MAVRPDARPGLDRRLVALMAVAGGAAVANLYYAQPLLPAIGAAFGVSDAAAGLLVTVTQLGYAVGLMLLVPLGDLVDRRRLVVRLLAVCALALVIAAAAPSLGVLALALAVTAVASVAAQVLVPFASTLADEADRGRVVGVVMSGLLTGILLARAVAGVLAAAAGWRAPFLVAAGVTASLAAILARALPRPGPSLSLPYPALLSSIATLMRTEPVLRRRMVLGACGFAGFSLAWTSLAFLLSSAPYDFGEEAIGAFGLAGLAGAVAAQRLGRLVDRGAGRRATQAVLAMAVLSWGALALGATSVPALVAGLVLLDFAVQGQNVVSQSLLSTLGSGTISRMTTAYVTANFAGGAVGSASSAIAWSAGGWHGVCAAGAAITAVAWAVSLAEPC